MQKLVTFSNPEFGNVRGLTIQGEPWLVGKDVAITLGYKNPRDALANHVDSEDKGVANCDTLGGTQEMTVINESGLYSLILGSKLPGAKKFKRWVTSEVLPSIRKTGGYIAGQESMTDQELMAKALMVAQKTIEERNRQIEMMKPKEIFADAVATSHTSILVGELAKILKGNGVEIGQNRLFAELRNR
ncbi:MAG: phage antirepressor, partial [Solobacterium sp.]|nr:phage antirepressor [Solobacterium sp.]